MLPKGVVTLVTGDDLQASNCNFKIDTAAGSDGLCLMATPKDEQRFQQVKLIDYNEVTDETIEMLVKLAAAKQFSEPSIKTSRKKEQKLNRKKVKASRKQSRKSRGRK